LMPDRRDAFLAAAEIALAIERIARSSGSNDTVATTGVCDLFPGAINSVPSRARLDVDVRDIDEARRDRVLHDIAGACETIAARRGVAVRSEPINADPPAQCAPTIVEAIERACDARARRHRRMISRAYHDSLFMSRIAPTGMIFIPCRDGISHRPEEYASPDSIAHGTEILADTLATLAGSS
jgi:ureidoglycolate amidohydrolase